MVDKILRMLKSRKFWAMVVAVVTAASLMATSQITAWEFAQALVAALAVYSTGVAIEDAGRAVGGLVK